MLTNTGNGSFGTAVNYPIGITVGLSFGIDLGDLNGDGNLDIAVNIANEIGKVFVLTGTGLGSFSPAVNYSVGTYPRSVALGDLNNDGKLDLAVAIQGGISSVAVFSGTGTASFGTLVNYNVDLGPQSLALGDFNRDGKLDMATANAFNNTVSVLSGSAIGGFSTATNYNAGEYPKSIAVGDMNNDGKLDMAVANTYGDDISILTGKDIGGFDLPINFNSGSRPWDIALGDLNGDGKIDMVVTNWQDNKVSVLINNSDAYITGFTPNDVLFDQSITIAGCYLNNISSVRFAGGVIATPISVTQTQVVVKVPCGANSGLITLTGTSKTAISPSILTISDPSATIIRTQPISQTMCDGSVAIFSVSATGTGLSYLWNNGATTSSISTSTIGSYWVTVSGTCGKVVSNVVTNTLGSPTTILSQPTSQTICGGAMAIFTVSATGNGLSYLWNNGATTPNFLTSIAGNYLVTVSGTCSKVVSNTVTNTVNIPTAILIQPTSQTICGGSMAVFSVSATGSGLSYLWNNGATTSSISTSNLGNYVVTVSGLCGKSVSNIVNNTANTPTAILIQPTSQTICGGAMANFTVSATGSGLSYLWNNGATTPNILTSIAGNYSVTVSGTCGKVVSNTVTNTVNIPTAILIQPTSQTICGGSMAVFSVSATGSGLSYLWNNGATTSSISTSNPGNYVVTVSGLCGKAVSNIAYNTVILRTSIITQPITQTVFGATNANFVISAIGSNLTYLWNNGATTTGISTSIAGNYMVTVAGTCGTSISSIASLKYNLTISANSFTRIYNTTNPTFSGTITGLVNGDAISVNYLTSATSLSGVGNYPIIPLVNGATLVNYNITTIAGVLTITKASLTVQANNTSRIYNTLNPTFSGIVTGLANGDVIIVNYLTSATSLSEVGIYSIYPSVAGSSLANYSLTTIGGILTINIATQTLTFGNFGYITYGMSVVPPVTISSGLPVSFSVTGPAVVVGNAISFTGVGNVTVTAYQMGNVNYLSASKSTTLSVYQATQTLTFSTIPYLTYRSSPFALTASVTSGLPVGITLTGPATIANGVVSVTGVGIVTITAFNDGNANYLPLLATRTFNIYKADQTITFSRIPYLAYTSVLFALTASVTSGLPVSFSVSGSAILTGNLLSLSGIGLITVTAYQVGNANYSSATPVVQIFGVYYPQTITMGNFGYVTYGMSVVPAVTVSSGLPISFSVTGPAVVVGNAISFTGVGNVTVTASQVGNADYLPATPISRTTYVYQAPQTLTLSAIPYLTYTSSPFALTASVTSSLPVGLTLTGASFANGVVSVTGAGIVTITAFNAGNGNYQPILAVRTFNVYKANQTITFSTIPYLIYTGIPFALIASVTSGLPVSFSVSGPAFISGNLLSLSGIGFVTVTAYQVGNANYSVASSVVQTFRIYYPQTITMGNFGYVTYGMSLVPAVTVSSGLPVSFSVTGPALVVGNTISFTGVGNVTVTVFQAGNTDYPPATKSTSLYVYQATQTLTLPPIPYLTYTSSPFALTASVTSGLLVGVTLTGPASIANGVVSVTGVGIVTITAFNAGNANYLPLLAIRTFNIYKADQTISFQNIGTRTYKDVFDLIASSTSGLPIYFSISGLAAISGNSISITGVGVVTVTAFQSGNSNFKPATNFTQIFNAVKASQTINFQPIAIRQFNGADFYIVCTDPDFFVNATSTSGLVVSFTSSNLSVAGITGNFVRKLGLGETTITAYQLGNSNYLPATQIQVLRICEFSQSGRLTSNVRPPRSPIFNRKIIALSSSQSSYFDLALQDDGTVIMWPEDPNGSVGFVPSNLSGAIAISAGLVHSLALRRDGTVTTWGSNYLGVLNIPPNLNSVVGISAGNYHSLAFRSDGTVVAWGSNSYGQLNIPPNLNSVVGISAAGLFSLALRSDGTVVAWGNNDNGQLNIPPSLNSVVGISAGAIFSVALRRDGTVVAWGDNRYGQLNISPNAKIKSISAGASNSLALYDCGNFGTRLDFTKVSSEEEKFSNESFWKIFPNPNYGLFSIAINNHNEETEYNITLFDLLGQKLHEEQFKTFGSTTKDFNLKHLQTGTYMVKIATETHIEVKKIVIE